MEPQIEKLYKLFLSPRVSLIKELLSYEHEYHRVLVAEELDCVPIELDEYYDEASDDKKKSVEDDINTMNACDKGYKIVLNGANVA